MSKKLDSVVELLENAGIAKAGEDLYIYSMPENVRSGILVLDDPDTPTEIDEYLPKLKKSDFRCIVRGNDYEQAMNLAYMVREELDKYEVTTTTGLKFLRIKPTYDPIAYPVSGGDVIEVSVNLWAAYIEP